MKWDNNNQAVNLGKGTSQRVVGGIQGMSTGSGGGGRPGLLVGVHIGVGGFRYVGMGKNKKIFPLFQILYQML